MGAFKGGVSVNYPKGKRNNKKQRYLLIRAGPLRGMYVHDVVAWAKLGRPLEKDETVEHEDGQGLNVDPGNITVVTRKVNTHLRHVRERKARAAEAGQGDIPWANQF